MNNSLSRRDLLAASAAVGLSATGMGSMGVEQVRKLPKMEPKLVHVPTEADIAKALKTASAGISEATHKAHLGLWQGYANKTNEIRKALAEMEMDATKANQIYSQIRALKVNYAFAYGGYKNHNVYFDTIGGNGGPATGDVAGLINEAYGSHEAWAKDLKTTGIGARGWVYLAQDTFPSWNSTLILALDVYEHAYFLDFQTARAKYIDAYLNVIDWDAVNARLHKGLGK